MKGSQLSQWRVGVLCLAAAGSTYLLRVTMLENAPARRAAIAERGQGGGGGERGRTKSARPAALALPLPHSTDTLEAILMGSEAERYSRLALWLLDADAEQVAACWESCRDQPWKSSGLTELIFIRWTELDPQGAIAAVARGGG